MIQAKSKMLMAVALIVIAGCAKKKVEDLPPPPPQTSQAAPQAAPDTAPAGTAAVPGSRADFLQQAGTDTIHFATDSYTLDGEATAILTKQVQWLKQYPNVRVTVEGHCDERGTREYNLALGDRRANAVKNFLATNGVDAGRLSTISYGKERPVANGSDEDSWAQNRRAVSVVPE